MQSNNTTEEAFCVNASRDSVTGAFVIDDDAVQGYNYLVAVVYLLFSVVGLPWNLLVIVTIVKQRLYTQPTIILILNLVVTDFFVILLVLPFVAVTGLAGEFVFGDSDKVKCEVCRANLIVDKAFFFSSLLTITLLAFDRFLFIYKPLRYKNLITVRRVVLAVAIIWILSVVLSLIPWIVARNVVFSPELLQCKWDIPKQSNIGVISVLGLLIPYVFGIVCNVWVIVIAVRNIRTIYKVQINTLERSVSRKVLEEHVRRTRNKKQLHLTRVFGGIICSNTLAWLPFIVLAFLNLGSVAAEPPLEFIVTAHVLFSLQVVIHPILETTLINNVRRPLKKMVTFDSCRKNDGSISGKFSSSKPSSSAVSSSYRKESASSQNELMSEVEEDGLGGHGGRKCCCYRGENSRWFCGCGYLEIFDAAMLPWNDNYGHTDNITGHTPYGDITDHTHHVVIVNHASDDTIEETSPQTTPL